MQTAAIPGYRLAKAKQSTRILTTLGLLALTLGILSALALTLTRTGVMPTDVGTYYLGKSYLEPSNQGGLDSMLEAGSRKSLQHLAEVTHLHLVGGSILLFMLCHLLSVCDLSEQTRIFWYVISFLSYLLTFIAPWLIVYASSKFAYLFGPAVLLFILSLLVLIYLPLREMWGRAKS
ncbi:hypothetical protein JNK13_07280 [bacterium]|nr:hypothetical protein [bacterium]